MSTLAVLTTELATNGEGHGVGGDNPANLDPGTIVYDVDSEVANKQMRSLARPGGVPLSEYKVWWYQNEYVTETADRDVGTPGPAVSCMERLRQVRNTAIGGYVPFWAAEFAKRREGGTGDTGGVGALTKAEQMRCANLWAVLQEDEGILDLASKENQDLLAAARATHCIGVDQLNDITGRGSGRIMRHEEIGWPNLSAEDIKRARA